MKVTLSPAQPEAVTKFNLECGGSVIGYVQKNEERNDHHVVINMGNAEGNGLYQGHGATVEAAIMQMLERHERYANAQLRRLAELREMLIGEEK